MFDESLQIDFTLSAEWHREHDDYVAIAVYYDVTDEFVDPYMLTIEDGGSSVEFWSMLHYDYDTQ